MNMSNNINAYIFKVNLFETYLKGIFESSKVNITKLEDEIKVTLSCSFLDIFRFSFDDESILNSDFDQITDIYGNSISKLSEANTVMTSYINVLTKGFGGEVSRWWDRDTSIDISPSIVVYFNYSEYEIKVTFKNELITKGFLKIFKFDDISPSDLLTFVNELKLFEYKNQMDYDRIMNEFAENTENEFSERFIKCLHAKSTI